MAEWSKATDCKSVEVFYVGSNPASPTFVVDFREEKVGLSGQPSEALSFFLPCIVCLVGELLRSIVPSISNPNETRIEASRFRPL